MAVYSKAIFYCVQRRPVVYLCVVCCVCVYTPRVCFLPALACCSLPASYAPTRFLLRVLNSRVGEVSKASYEVFWRLFSFFFFGDTMDRLLRNRHPFLRMNCSSGRMIPQEEK